MTQLTENLYCIEVPESAKNVKISSLNNLYEYGDFGIKNILYELPIDDKFQVLGTLTKDEVSFDCEPYVEVSSTHSLKGKDEIICMYKIYSGKFTESTSMFESFRSLIEYKTGKLFVNPYGDQPELMHYENLEKYRKAFDEWQQAENNLLKKLVIIKKV